MQPETPARGSSRLGRGTGRAFRRWGRAARWLVATLVVPALVGEGSALGAASKDDEVLVALDMHVSVPVPSDMARQQESLGPRGDMLTLTDGGDVIVLVVYREGAARAPGARAALETHVAELQRSLGPAETHRATRRLLGHDEPTVVFSVTRGGVEREASVVAAQADDRTIVVSAVLVKGSPNERVLLSLLRRIRVS